MSLNGLWKPLSSHTRDTARSSKLNLIFQSTPNPEIGCDRAKVIVEVVAEFSFRTETLQFRLSHSCWIYSTARRLRIHSDFYWPLLVTEKSRPHEMTTSIFIFNWKKWKTKSETVSYVVVISRQENLIVIAKRAQQERANDFRDLFHFLSCDSAQFLFLLRFFGLVKSLAVSTFTLVSFEVKTMLMSI